MAAGIEGSTVLVTGGAGFIGSHLCLYLCSLGAKEVRCIDSFEFGSATNLEPRPRNLSIASLHIGTASPAELDQAFAKVDYVFHLAAEKHNSSLDKPQQMLTSNIQGTLNVLNASARAGAKRLVFSSSLYAYGRNVGLPLQEAERPAPNTVYGISKLAGENLAHMLNASGKLETTVLRYFFVYGTKQYANAGYKSVIVKNFERILNGLPPVIFGDGCQALDYIFVDDVLRATVQAMLHPESGLLLNLGSGKGTSILELTQHMQEISGSTYAPVFEPPDLTHGTSRVADTRSIARHFDWSPRTSLREGLTTVFEWMKRRQ